MATVYILYSALIDKYYIGSCLDFYQRFQSHVNGEFKGSYTAKVKDWKEFFKVDHLNYEQARKIEKHIKSMKSRRYIENLKRYPDIISKLKKRYE